MQEETLYITSDTGGRKGSKVQRFDMMPTDALEELATRYGKGAGKYETAPDEPDNWRKGYNWSLSFAAAYRHLTAAMGGEDIDEETGDKHVTAVAWHMFTLIHYMNDPERYGRFDDRQAVVEERWANRRKNQDLIEEELKKQMDPDVYEYRQRMLDGLFNQTSRKDA